MRSSHGCVKGESRSLPSGWAGAQLEAVVQEKEILGEHRPASMAHHVHTHPEWKKLRQEVACALANGWTWLALHLDRSPVL